MSIALSDSPKPRGQVGGQVERGGPDSPTGSLRVPAFSNPQLQGPLGVLSGEPGTRMTKKIN